ncbi:MAG: formate dehydrogenase accessory protein FdhE, partial [Candidatus Rokubacteria bacterium]|nr:formate dehydrogenase accessory protein FdhE [Candidatus Rokubacteria bacterium]
APDVVAFLAVASLRPDFEAYFDRVREHLAPADWRLGICPFCGAPPGWGDFLEDGRRRLACHLCGGAWVFSRVACPFCGDESTGNLRRLEAGERDEGYWVSACTACHGYLKEIDRRVRWNGRSALVEDWGSPHLDLVAVQGGLWRPMPTLLGLMPQL